MKKMFGVKIRAFALAIFLVFLVGRSGVYTSAQNSTMNLLVVGVDNASENTDVISVVRLDGENGAVSFVQIPRDTYCTLDAYQNKINHIYSIARANGKNREESISMLRSFIEDALSIKLDGHILVDGDDFVKLVDSIGGVDVTLDEDLTLYNNDKSLLVLYKGRNHLDGKSAMLFVRHRNGYLRGDIDRLDMQSIFIRGLFDTLMSSVGVFDIPRVVSAFRGCETDISTKSLISLFGMRNSFSSSSPSGYILPGEAIKGKNGVWYYAVNKRGCDELISHIFMTDSGSFDKDNRLLNKSDDDFKKIYFR